MGYMTNITILNDHFNWIEDNPETFVKAIKYGMNSGTDDDLLDDLSYRAQTDEERAARLHYVTVHKAQHMDTPQIIFSEANGTYPVHELCWGPKLERYLNRWGNKATRIRILRGVVNKLRRYAGELEAELDAIEKEQGK